MLLLADTLQSVQPRISQPRRKRHRHIKAMSDVGGARPGGKPRPLGQVKTENLFFHAAGGIGTRCTPLLPVPLYPDLRRPPTSEEGLRTSIKSMRELRESLRHAALLNIVAAANSQGPSPSPTQHLEKGSSQDVRLHFLGTSPSQLPPPHHHRTAVTPSSPLTLQGTAGARATSPLSQTAEEGKRGGGGGGGRSAGSHHSSKRDSASPPLPSTLVANLLSPRMRTISIPRQGVRGHDLSGPFIHKSLSQAKECLTKVGQMVRSRTEVLDRQGEASGRPTTFQAHEGRVAKDSGGQGHNQLLPVKGQGLETQRSHTVLYLSGRDRAGGLSHNTKLGIGHPNDTTTVASITVPPNSASSSRSNTADYHSAGTDNRSARVAGEDGSGTIHQQQASVRRHLTPGKKRDLVKRLTEMAKCEAVDMTNPMTTENEAKPTSRPPMIILSQQRHEIRLPEDSVISAASTAAHVSKYSQGDSDRQSVSQGGGNGMYRTKSLSSLLAGSSGQAHPTMLQRGTVSVVVSDRPSTLQKAQSGSMPDLVMQGGPPSTAGHQHDMKRTDSSDWTAATAYSFTDGIVGKTLLKDGEAGEGRGPVESRPLLPVNPKIRSRRGARPSSRLSSMGLKDRGPLDSTNSAVPNTATPSTNTNFVPATRESRSRSSTMETGQSAESSVPYSNNLPVLTITGLNRDRLPAGTPAANSRASRELRPTSRTGVSSNMQWFQKLDDQYEKLQRQLNIGVTVPRRTPHWQSSTIIHAMPINRTDVSAHLQCLSLGEGKGTDPDIPSQPTSSPTVLRHPQARAVGNTLGIALSDVEEQSIGGGLNSHRTFQGESECDHLRNDLGDSHGRSADGCRRSLSRSGGLSDQTRGNWATMTDPVFQGKKEPRYQGFSSRVPEKEARSQFHYVTPNSGSASEPQDERDRKYRVLKALDQDVYYDFQHRKYRNTPGSTPLAHCNNEQPRPRVHFYKVKVNGEL